MSTDNTQDMPIDTGNPQVWIFPTAKFPLGTCYITPGAQAALAEGRHTPFEFLARHQAGDWGDVCPEDAGYNDDDLRDGGRLISAYHTRLKVKIWIITEWDRSASTILLPSEY